MEIAELEAILQKDRSRWWNPDFLDLLVHRWNLPAGGAYLDVGAGRGGWGSLFLDRCTPQLAVFLDTHAVDFSKTPLYAPSVHGLRWVQADARALPFPNDYFDFTTCQTLLIHVDDANQAVGEMVRVTKPGGLVACTEPFDLPNCATVDRIFLDGDSGELIRHLHVWCHYLKGRRDSGAGDLNIGERLPWLLQANGLLDIKAYQSDRLKVVLPPYTDPVSQDELKAAVRPTADDDLFMANVRKWYVAAGGDARTFSRYLDDLEARAVRRSEAVKLGSFGTCGGVALYVVSGRVPT